MTAALLVVTVLFLGQPYTRTAIVERESCMTQAETLVHQLQQINGVTSAIGTCSNVEQQNL